MPNIKDPYERAFLELLLRHQLPDDCEVEIEVSTKSSKTPGKAVFSLRGRDISVKADMSSLKLRRIVNRADPLPTCW